MAEPMDDRELERLMKEGLERRAADVDEGAARQLVAAAREGSARRSWRTTAVVGLAAASVAGIALATFALNDDDTPTDRTPHSDRTIVDPIPKDWRLEAWHGVTVRVPADWGWGGAPMPDIVDPESGSNGEPIDCGAMAYIGPEGGRYVNGEDGPNGDVHFLNGDPSVPYVGRPLMMTDACVGQLGEGNWRPPTAPYVWLGAPVEPGTVEFLNGYVMETVEVSGSTVSVATRDAALREQILATAGRGETCRSEYDGAPTIQVVPREGVPEVTGMTVCAYSEVDGLAQLTYATHVGAAATRSFKDAVSRSPVANCQPKEAHEWVLLTVEGAGGLRQEHLVQLGECSGIQLLPGDQLIELNDETVAPWAVDGIPAYVVGPYGGKGVSGEFFRGILG